MNSSLWRVFEDQMVDGKYALQRLLGVGSYGGVFLADEVVADRLIRQVAVKLMETAEAGRDAQMQELIAAANLDHSGLLRSFTCGLCELNRVPLLYLVTELAEETLEDRILAGALPPEEAHPVALSVASALSYLHEQSSPLVHRDIKPANVMRAGTHWKLGDFGLLRATDSQNPRQTGTMVGTAAYAPPESYRGAISPAWDIWSFGVLLAEMLTGRLPFDGDTPHRLMIAVSSQEPVLASTVPEPFEAILRGCLAKDPAARWSAGQVVDALTESRAGIRTGPSEARLPDAFYARLCGPPPNAPVNAPLVVSRSGDHDFLSLTEALLSAPPNGVIHVMPGEYRESLILNRPVTIEAVGQSGSVIVESRGAACLVMQTDAATVRGLTLISQADTTPGLQSSYRKHPAVQIGQGELTLEACWITGTSTVCVSVRGSAARSTLHGCRIHNGKLGGIAIVDGAVASLNGCEIFANGGVGVECLSGAALHMMKCVVRHGQDSGIAFESAGGTVTDCDIHGNAGAGLLIGSGGTPDVRKCRLFDGTQTGVTVRDGGQGSLEECDIHGNMLSNVLIAQGANPALRRCRIHGGHSNGIWVSQNGQGVIEDCEVFGNTFAGLKVSHSGNPLVRRTTVRDGKRTGVSIHERSRATLIDCDIAANAQAGVLAETGAQLFMRQCIVRDGKECGVWIACDGTLEGCEVMGNAGAGIELRQGGKPALTACRIHNGLHVGVLAQGGALAILTDCDIYDNALAGVAIGECSRVDVRSCRIYDGKQVGLVYWDRARGVVEECEIHGNALGGIRILQESDPLIRKCRINRNGRHGVHVSERSEGAVIDCDLTGNQMESLFVEAGCATQAIGNTQ